MKSGKIVGVIAIKGGVGKTTTVSNLGAILANEFGKNVLIVDANFSAPNLGLHLGIVNPKVTLHDVLSSKKSIFEAIYAHEDGFHIIPSSLVPAKKVNPLMLKQKLDKLRKYYDVILLDSSPSLNEEILATMMASDELLVVTSPDYPTLSCTMNAVRVAKQRKTPIAGLILNKVRDKKFELNRAELEMATNVPVLAVIPDDIKVLEALAATKSAALHSPLCNAAIEYKKLAAGIIGEQYEDPRFKAKVRSMLGLERPYISPLEGQKKV